MISQNPIYLSRCASEPLVVGSHFHSIGGELALRNLSEGASVGALSVQLMLFRKFSLFGSNPVTTLSSDVTLNQ